MTSRKSVTLITAARIDTNKLYHPKHRHCIRMTSIMPFRIFFNNFFFPNQNVKNLWGFRMQISSETGLLLWWITHLKMFQMLKDSCAYWCKFLHEKIMTLEYCRVENLFCITKWIAKWNSLDKLKPKTYNKSGKLLR